MIFQFFVGGNPQVSQAASLYVASSYCIYDQSDLLLTTMSFSRGSHIQKALSQRNAQVFLSLKRNRTRTTIDLKPKLYKIRLILSHKSGDSPTLVSYE